MKLDTRTTTSAALLGFSAWLTLCSTALAQPGPGQRPGGFGLDPRAEDRTYHFSDTDEDLPYCVFASSKIEDGEPAPLVIALHGLGAGPQIMCNATAIDLAEEGGYVYAAPMGYNTGGWYGSPVIQMGGPNAPASDITPEELQEFSEKDVMNVLEMVRDEFDIDEDRIYLTGHSMGGAGTYFLGAKHADMWAAVAPVAAAAFRMNDYHDEIVQDIADGGAAIIVVHGDADEVVSVDISRTWTATMDELGIEHEYVELPGVTHGPVITASQEAIFEFFGRHSRQDP